MNSRRPTRRLLQFAALGTVAAVALSSVASTSSASAATSPQVGECFDMSQKQADGEQWPSLEPVPCTSPHTVQIAKVGAIPAGIGVEKYVAKQCDYKMIVRSVGLNQVSGGDLAVVEAPVRAGSSWFLLPGGGFLCTASIYDNNGSKPLTFVTVDSLLADLSPRQLEEFRYCSYAKGRAWWKPKITVSCLEEPRWEVTFFIEWFDMYRSFPGQATLTRISKAVCGPTAQWNYITRSLWQSGVRRTQCIERVG